MAELVDRSAIEFSRGDEFIARHQQLLHHDHLRRMPEIQSPNVLLNQMTDAERAAFRADYNKQGPAGRPAAAAS